MIEIGTALLERLPVTHAGGRRDEHARPAVVHAPAELDVVAVEVDRRVESADLAEQIGTDQHEGRRRDEHIADTVVLFLVDLTLLDEVVDLAESVESESDRL